MRRLCSSCPSHPPLGHIAFRSILGRISILVEAAHCFSRHATPPNKSPDLTAPRPSVFRAAFRQVCLYQMSAFYSFRRGCRSAPAFYFGGAAMKIPADCTVILISRFHGQTVAHSNFKRLPFIGSFISAAAAWAVPTPEVEQRAAPATAAGLFTFNGGKVHWRQWPQYPSSMTAVL